MCISFSATSVHRTEKKVLLSGKRLHGKEQEVPGKLAAERLEQKKKLDQQKKLDQRWASASGCTAFCFYAGWLRCNSRERAWEAVQKGAHLKSTIGDSSLQIVCKHNWLA